MGGCPDPTIRRPKGEIIVIVLAWIGQVVLFFILWRIFHWLAGRFLVSVGSLTMFVDMGINLLLAIVLLVFLNLFDSAWWLMASIGAIVGIFTGILAARVARERGVRRDG
jgi:hypothetical protein